MTFSKPISDYISQRLNNGSTLRMEGWCTPEKATALVELVFKSQPKTAVEIGVYAGRSLFAIALAMKELGEGEVLGIDPWSPSASVAGWEDDPANRDWWSKLDHSSILAQCTAVQKQLELDNVRLFRGTSQQAYQALKFGHPEPWLDMLHIDGNHSPAQALFDVESYVPMVKHNGMVVFDDINWETTQPAQKRLLDLCEKVGGTNEWGMYSRRSYEVVGCCEK